MKTSENTADLFKALAEAQAELTDPGVSATNDHFNSRYAKLSDGTAIIRPVLSKHGLSYVQGVAHDEHLGPVMVTRITHSTAQWVESMYPIGVDKNAQKMASANTYARRHSLFAAVGIAPLDDDGNDASGNNIREPDPRELEKAYSDGAQSGRRWAVEQFAAKARSGYHGASFAKALADAGVTHSLEHVKLWCLWLGKDKPSTLTDAQREALVGYLASEKGAKSWAAFTADVALPVPVKKAKKAAPAWAPGEEAAFNKRLAELDWKPEEVEGYLAANDRPHPSRMDAEKRDKLLKWLEKEGGEKLLAWIDAQKGGEE